MSVAVDSSARRIGLILAVLVAGVWLVNGLIFKLLGFLPRHLEIVQAVPGLGGGRGEWVLTFVGVGELLLAGWVSSGRFPRACAASQTVALLAMNATELAFARSHLLTPAGLLPINLAFLALAWAAAELRTIEPFYWLRRHPFPVDAHFDHSLVLTYALPKAVLEPLLPPGLRVDTHGEYGFVAAAIVRTRRLRPGGFPPALGQDFVLTGYRIFTTFRHNGRTRRGLYILRSDADRRRMVLFGNLLTHYRYRHCRAQIAHDGGRMSVAVRTRDGAADLDVEADLTAADERLPAGSVFASPHDARRFAGPLPYTFDYERTTHSVVVIKGERRAWSPRVVPVEVRQIGFLDRPPFADARPVLCSAFHVRDIAYRWQRGVRVPLQEDQ